MHQDGNPWDDLVSSDPHYSHRVGLCSEENVDHRLRNESCKPDLPVCCCAACCDILRGYLKPVSLLCLSREHQSYPSYWLGSTSNGTWDIGAHTCGTLIPNLAPESYSLLMYNILTWRLVEVATTLPFPACKPPDWASLRPSASISELLVWEGLEPGITTLACN